MDSGISFTPQRQSWAPTPTKEALPTELQTTTTVRNPGQTIKENTEEGWTILGQTPRPQIIAIDPLVLVLQDMLDNPLYGPHKEAYYENTRSLFSVQTTLNTKNTDVLASIVSKLKEICTPEDIESIFKTLQETGLADMQAVLLFIDKNLSPTLIQDLKNFLTNYTLASGEKIKPQEFMMKLFRISISQGLSFQDLFSNIRTSFTDYDKLFSDTPEADPKRNAKDIHELFEDKIQSDGSFDIPEGGNIFFYITYRKSAESIENISEYQPLFARFKALELYATKETIKGYIIPFIDALLLGDQKMPITDENIERFQKAILTFLLSLSDQEFKNAYFTGESGVVDIIQAKLQEQGFSSIVNFVMSQKISEGSELIANINETIKTIQQSPELQRLNEQLQNISAERESILAQYPAGTEIPLSVSAQLDDLVQQVLNIQEALEKLPKTAASVNFAATLARVELRYIEQAAERGLISSAEAQQRKQALEFFFMNYVAEHTDWLSAENKQYYLQVKLQVFVHSDTTIQSLINNYFAQITDPEQRVESFISKLIQATIVLSQKIAQAHTEEIRQELLAERRKEISELNIPLGLRTALAKTLGIDPDDLDPAIAKMLIQKQFLA